MVIKAKIEKSDKDLDAEREKVILKGGQVSADIEKKDENRKAISLRFPLELLELIDKAVEERYGMTRTTWLLQAAQEKLERENENRNS